MQENVSIMCSWCGWENPSLGLRAARPMLYYALGMDFTYMENGAILTKRVSDNTLTIYWQQTDNRLVT